MRLTEILERRTTPAAGLYLAITRRCPLGCAHCSTRSSLRLAESDPAPFRAVVGSFTADDRPEIVCLTGGEPMLRPALVLELAQAIARVGARVTTSTGAFFATGADIPWAIDRALAAMDHVTVSMDEHHDREVPREDSIRLLHRLVTRGQHTSVQLVGTGPDDRYVVETVDALDREFGDEVAVLVGTVAPIGRAATPGAVRLVRPARASGSPRPGEVAQGCPMLSWPVVSYDGEVVACCNQAAVDGSRPGHLYAGSGATTSWPAIRRFVTDRALSRVLRLVGPEYVAARAAPGALGGGACSTCHHLGDHPEVEEWAQAVVARPSTGVIEALAARHLAGRPLPGSMPELAALVAAANRPAVGP